MSKDKFSELWDATRSAYEQIAGADKIVHNNKSRGRWQPLTLYKGGMHYEWNSHFSKHEMRICFDAESRDINCNQRLIDAIWLHKSKIEHATGRKLHLLKNNPASGWGRIAIIQSIERDWPNSNEIEIFARLMHSFVLATRKIVEQTN